MAKIMFKRGLRANLPTTAVDGTLYLTTDANDLGLYVGIGTDMRRIGDYNVVASISDLPTNANEKALFYCEAENVLARWNGSAWIQINKQPTADEMKVALGLGTAAYKNVEAFDAAGAAAQALADAKSYTDTEVEAAKPSVYTGTDFDTVVAGIDAVKKGDVVVISTTLAEGKVEKSAYQYDGTQWVACDGMVDADKVILKENITMAGNYTTVGNLTKTQNGTATFATAGKSVSEAFLEIFSKRLQPSITANPAVTLNFAKAGAYEVGTKVTPEYSASLSAGSYTYGPATGITATAWSVTDTKSGSATTASGSFSEFTVGDGENYKITAEATHGAGAIAKDNLGANSDPVVQIAAGTKSKVSGAITGYRSFFYGVLPTSTAEAPLTSAIVRGLTNGGAYNAQKKFTINANATAKRIVIAVPSSSTRAGLSSVILTSAMNTPVTGSYVKTAKGVKVEGVNGYTAVDYDVWVYEPAAIDAGEVHAVTLG